MHLAALYFTYCVVFLFLNPCFQNPNVVYFFRPKESQNLKAPGQKVLRVSDVPQGFVNRGMLANHLKFNPLHVLRPTQDRPEQCNDCRRTFPDQRTLTLALG